MSSRRKKRASPTDLYQSCLQGGDCIPDVQNKFENRTIADWLLKIFGSVIYLGNLGIGSGKGTGGSFGYRPLGAGGSGKPISELPVGRPNIVIDPITPQTIVPIEPGASSIVPLAEGGIDTSFLTPEAGPGLGGEDIELFTFSSPTLDVGGVGGGPSVISTELSETAFIDATPAPPATKQILYDAVSSAAVEVHINPFLQTSANDTNIFVDSLLTGETVGEGTYENIPLDSLYLQTRDVPLESTPIQTSRLQIKSTGLYSRFIEQVPVYDPDFLVQPSRLVQFEFENPAFDPEISLRFEQDVDTLRAAPNTAFADVAYLGRPQLTSTADRAVRLSRLGTRAALKTRSGLTVGPQVHFYMDISNIIPENIELSVIDSGRDTTVVDDLLKGIVLDDPANAADVQYNDDDLLDALAETFDNTHIVVQGVSDETDTTALPIPLPTNISKVFITDIAENGLFPNINIDSNITPAFNKFWSSVVPFQDIDFTIDPSLLYRKRRRLDIV